jgi:hypothetical protein
MSVAANSLHVGIAARNRVAVYFNQLLRQVHEPEFRDAGRGVKRRLDPAVLRQRRVGHFDDQQSLAGMLSGIDTRRDECDIGLRLRVLRQRERAVRPDFDVWGEGAAESSGELGDHVGVKRALRSHLDEIAEQQLDA